MSQIVRAVDFRNGAPAAQGGIYALRVLDANFGFDTIAFDTPLNKKLLYASQNYRRLGQTRPICERFFLAGPTAGSLGKAIVEFTTIQDEVLDAVPPAVRRVATYWLPFSVAIAGDTIALYFRAPLAGSSPVTWRLRRVFIANPGHATAAGQVQLLLEAEITAGAQDDAGDGVAPRQLSDSRSICSAESSVGTYGAQALWSAILDVPAGTDNPLNPIVDMKFDDLSGTKPPTLIRGESPDTYFGAGTIVGFRLRATGSAGIAGARGFIEWTEET